MDKPKRKNAKGYKVWTAKRLLVSILAIAYGWFALYMFSNRLLDENASTALTSFLVDVTIVIVALSIYTIPPALRTQWRSLLMAMTTTILFLIVAVPSHPIILLCVPMLAMTVIGFAMFGSIIYWIIERLLRKKKKTHYALTTLLMLLPYLLTAIKAGMEPAT